MDHHIRSAVDSGQLPGAVLMAQDATGKINVCRTYGVRSLRSNLSTKPTMTEDTVMRLASCTKLLTSVMVLQCVERGILNLDSPVEKLVPELGQLKILTGYDDSGNPKLKDTESSITLNHLLTHSSGTCYAPMDPNLTRWATSHNMPLVAENDTIEANFLYPLKFEPGTDWGYGTGYDWAGRVVEKATGMSLEDFMQKNICKPLGTQDMTFYLQRHSDLITRRADAAVRDPATGISTWMDDAKLNKDPVDCMGGMGVFASPEAYMKVLYSLLVNDGKLLKPATRDLMFKPALSPQCEKRCNEVGYEQAEWKPHELLPADVKKSHALCGAITLENADGHKWRRSGSISWAGMVNHYWVIDPDAGVCMLSAFHLHPWADPKCIELARAFEEEIYSQVA